MVTSIPIMKISWVAPYYFHLSCAVPINRQKGDFLVGLILLLADFLGFL
jgi:hypothetical protein